VTAMRITPSTTGRSRRLGAVVSALALIAGPAACARQDTHRRTVAVGAIDQSARAMLPPQITARGTLIIATDPTFAPDEFTQPDGSIGGMEVDLIRAVTAKLGLTASLTPTPFHTILAGVQQGKFDLGVSSMTDTTRREELGDFITYFQAGPMLIVRTGNPLDLFPDDESLCGHRVAAQQGTIEVDPVLSSRSAQCLTDGLPAITTVVVATVGDALKALLSGRADATLQDTPIAAYQTTHSDGQLQTAGDPIDPAPYGFALPKEDDALDSAMLTATQDVIDDGEYTTILKRWGLTNGAITTATLDGAIN